MKKNNDLNKFKIKVDFKNENRKMTAKISIKEVQESNVWRVWCGLPWNMDFRSNLELNQSYKVRTRYPALHGAIYLYPKNGIARHPVMGRYGSCWMPSRASGFWQTVGEGCPGPGSSWGDPAVPPAGKDAESQRHLFHGGGGEGVRRFCFGPNLTLVPQCSQLLPLFSFDSFP